MRQSNNNINRRIKIKLAEGQNNILAGWDKRIISMATKSLVGNNVELIVGSPITEITPTSVILQGGKQIESNLTVWTAGIKGYDVNATPQIERSKTGRQR